MADAKDITELYFGSTPVESMYLGSNLIYPRAPLGLVVGGLQYILVLYGNGTPLFYGNTTSSVANIPAICRQNTTSIVGTSVTAMALLKNGGIRVWGNTLWDIAVVPASALPSKHINLATLTGFSVRETDGAVVSWGRNVNNIRNIPAGLVGVEELISFNENVIIARKNDGTLVGWGTNTSNLLPIPAGLNSVTKIFVLPGSSAPAVIAIRQDGDWVAWGSGTTNWPFHPGPKFTAEDLVFITSSASVASSLHVLRVNGNLELHRNGDMQVIDTNIAVLATGSQYAIKNNGTVVPVADYFI